MDKEQTHYTQANQIFKKILSKFHNKEWVSYKLTGINFKKSSCVTFPSPDAIFYDSDQKLTIAFEFKPTIETRAGIIQGLGQAISYLTRANITFLVIPDIVENFKAEEYILSLLNNQLKDIPIGLITYHNGNIQNPKLIKNITNLKTFIEYSPITTSFIVETKYKCPICQTEFIANIKRVFCSRKCSGIYKLGKKPSERKYHAIP